jgi:type III restriction enzyme
VPDYEVPEPILNSPYYEPAEHWNIEEGASPEKRPGRRPAGYFYRDPKAPPSDSEHDARGTWQELKLANLIRDRVKQWRSQGYPGVTRTTLDLLNYWQREGRQHRLFFAQIEAAEAIIFLNEARADFRQGIRHRSTNQVTTPRPKASRRFNDMRARRPPARVRRP